MANKPEDRAAIYRQKAEQARAMTEGMRDESARVILLEVAAAWERLASAEDRNNLESD